jgi:hypothetical protein
MHFYAIRQSKEFIKDQIDNMSWKRIMGKDIETLTTDEIKSLIRDAFYKRIGEALPE